jgi:hypothetical protein
MKSEPPPGEDVRMDDDEPEDMEPPPKFPRIELLIRPDAVDPRPLAPIEFDPPPDPPLRAGLLEDDLNRFVEPLFAPRLEVASEGDAAVELESELLLEASVAPDIALPGEDEEIEELDEDTEELEELLELLEPPDPELDPPPALPTREELPPRPNFPPVWLPLSCGAMMAAKRSAAMVPEIRTVRSRSPNPTTAVATGGTGGFPGPPRWAERVFKYRARPPATAIAAAISPSKARGRFRGGRGTKAGAAGARRGTALSGRALGTLLI